MKISLRQKLINIIFIIALLILTYSGNSESNHREIKADQSSDTGLTGSIDVNRSMKYIFKNYDSNTRVSI